MPKFVRTPTVKFMLVLLTARVITHALESFTTFFLPHSVTCKTANGDMSMHPGWSMFTDRSRNRIK